MHGEAGFKEVYIFDAILDKVSQLEHVKDTSFLHRNPSAEIRAVRRWLGQLSRALSNYEVNMGPVDDLRAHISAHIDPVSCSGEGHV